MNYRTLGSTGLRVSTIGFGAWGIGGDHGGSVAYGATDDTQSAQALRCAYDMGVTFFDTSSFYGFGHSERLIGSTFKDVRDNVVIATKVGLIDADGTQDFSASFIRRSLEQSLKNLQSDYVDLLQLHSPPVDVLGDAGQTLRELQEQGLVRAFGVSVRQPDDALIAIDDHAYPVVQTNLNLIDQRALASGALAKCEQQGVGVIARTPLCFGFLTGRYSSGTSYDAGDHRTNWSKEQIDVWANAYAKFQDVHDRYPDQTAAQIALRYCMTETGVSTVIPGMLRDHEVQENAAAGGLSPLTERDMADIHEIYQSTSFFVARKRANSV